MSSSSLARPPPAVVGPSSVSFPSSHPSSKLLSSSKRVIMHIDCDCFYAQVERERFPHFRHRPCAVVQQGSFVVTSNYRCRARAMPKSWYLSPEIDHALAGTTATAATANSATPSSAGPFPLPSSSPAACTPCYSGSSMHRYRQMCRTWMQCFERFEGGKVTLMRRGIDECLLDLTALALERARKGLVKVHCVMPASELAEQNAAAAARFAQAEAAWRLAEASLPLCDRESTGALAPAMKASMSKDPMTAAQGVRMGGAKGGNPFVTTVGTANWGAANGKGEMKVGGGGVNIMNQNQAAVSTPSVASSSSTATPASASSSHSLLAISRESILKLPDHLVGKSEEEIEAFCDQLHPEDYCRARRGHEAPTNLYTAEEAQRLGLEVVEKSPWVGHVLLSGWGDERHLLEAKNESEEDDRQPYHTHTSGRTQRARRLGTEPASRQDVNLSADCGAMVPNEAVAPGYEAAAAAAPSIWPQPEVAVEWHAGDLVAPSSFPPGSLPTAGEPSHELLLAIGSQIAFELRLALFRQTGLTTSACVAPNPMLAKMGSALRKPNQQSILRSHTTTTTSTSSSSQSTAHSTSSIVRSFLRPLKLKSVPGFGPKAQQRLEQVGLAASTTRIGQLQATMAFSSGGGGGGGCLLQTVFGDKFGRELESIAIGVDDTPVKQLPAPKSLAQEKSKHVASEADLRDQVHWLVETIGVRLQEHESFWLKRAANLCLYWTEAATKEDQLARAKDPEIKTWWHKRVRANERVTLPSALYTDPAHPFAELHEAARALIQRHLERKKPTAAVATLIGAGAGASHAPVAPAAAAAAGASSTSSSSSFVHLMNVGVSVSAWRDIAPNKGAIKGEEHAKGKSSLMRFLTPTTTTAHTKVKKEAAALALAMSSVKQEGTPAQREPRAADPMDVDDVPSFSSSIVAASAATVASFSDLHDIDEAFGAGGGGDGGGSAEDDFDPFEADEMGEEVDRDAAEEEEDLLSMLHDRDADVAAARATPMEAAAPAAAAAAASSIVASTVACSQCGASVSNSPIALGEHADFHLAASLQQQLRRADRVQREQELARTDEATSRHTTKRNTTAAAAAGGGGAGKRKKSSGSTMTSKEADRASLQQFFKPTGKTARS